MCHVIQFPWVVVDYESDKLNLKDPATFRDFTKPVGIQNPAIEASVKERCGHHMTCHMISM